LANIKIYDIIKSKIREGKPPKTRKEDYYEKDYEG
jgi:hypothetical protein